MRIPRLRRSISFSQLVRNRLKIALSDPRDNPIESRTPKVRQNVLAQQSFPGVHGDISSFHGIMKAKCKKGLCWHQQGDYISKTKASCLPRPGLFFSFPLGTGYLFFWWIDLLVLLKSFFFFFEPNNDWKWNPVFAETEKSPLPLPQLFWSFLVWKFYF